MKYVYLLRAGENHYKVGIAVNVTKRLSGVQTGNPLQVEVVCARLVANDEEVEQSIHQSLHERRLNGGNEWFDLTPQQAIELAILINKNPEIDLTEQVTVKKLFENQQMQQKKIEKKLDRVLAMDEEYLKALEAERAAKRQAHALEQPPKKQPLSNHALVEQAKAILRQEGRMSTSLLQRRLSIGYGRASRVMDKLEEEGILGPLDGIHRDVLHIPQLIPSAA